MVGQHRCIVVRRDGDGDDVDIFFAGTIAGQSGIGAGVALVVGEDGEVDVAAEIFRRGKGQCQQCRIDISQGAPEDHVGIVGAVAG